MNDFERLVELLEKCPIPFGDCPLSCGDCKYIWAISCHEKILADYLIENGVTFKLVIKKNGQ